MRHKQDLKSILGLILKSVFVTIVCWQHTSPHGVHNTTERGENMAPVLMLVKYPEQNKHYCQRDVLPTSRKCNCNNVKRQRKPVSEKNGSFQENKNGIMSYHRCEAVNWWKIQKWNHIWSDGELLISCFLVNCLDVHVEKHPDRVALIWEKDEPGTEEKVTYR